MISQTSVSTLPELEIDIVNQHIYSGISNSVEGEKLITNKCLN